MGATISRPSEQKTFAYAELWSSDPFIVLINQNWWPTAYPLASEDKGDPWNIGGGARYKVDFPAPCWVVWQGTGQSGYRTLQTQGAASVEALDNAPGTAFLAVYPGINLIEFEGEPEEPGGEEPPETPEEPGEAPEAPGLPPGWMPNSIHLFYGGIQDTPVVSYYVEAKFVTLGIQRERYLRLWEKLEEELMEAISEFH